EALVELGPTFIKLGQFLSVRRDLLTPEMADELGTLQDKVPPFELTMAMNTIATELGQSPDKLFLEFEEEPIASASI
ncbi:AarF/UbiB family protein, partial [Acinetobacter baumannii]